VQIALVGAVVGPVVVVLGTMVTAAAALAPVLAAVSGSALAIGGAVVVAVGALVALYTKSEVARGVLKNLGKAMLWMVKNNPMLVPFKAVIRALGGWGPAFKKVELVILGFVRGVLQAFQSLVRIMLKIPGLPDGMRKSLKKASVAMANDMLQLEGQINETQDSLAGVGRQAPKTAKAFQAAVRPMMAKATSFAASISMAKYLWESWRPKEKKIVIRQTVISRNNLGGNPLIPNSGPSMGGNAGRMGGRAVGNLRGSSGGVDFFGNLVGNVSLADVLRYSQLSAAPTQAYLKQRIEASKKALQKLLSNRNQTMRRIKAVRALVKRLRNQLGALNRQYRSTRNPKRKNALRKRIGAVARQLENAQTRLENLTGTRDQLADTILSMGADIASDMEQLEGFSGGSTSGDTTSAVGGSEPTWGFRSRSAGASMGGAGFGGGTGTSSSTTVNVYPQSVDVESIARRVAFIINNGSVQLAAGVA
jgi:hypothetical protein